MPFKLLDNRRPPLATRMLARIQAHAAQRFILLQQPRRRIAKRLFIARHRQHAAVAVANMLRRRCLIVGHHAKP